MCKTLLKKLTLWTGLTASVSADWFNYSPLQFHLATERLTFFGRRPVKTWRQQHSSFGPYRPKSTSQYARTSIIIIPVYNTDLVTIWAQSYWHSDTGWDARDIQVTETHEFTQRLTKLASVLGLTRVYFRDKLPNWQNVLLCSVRRLQEENWGRRSKQKKIHRRIFNDLKELQRAVFASTHDPAQRTLVIK